MTVAVRDPVQELSDCLGSLRSALPRLGDNEVVQALRDLETLSRQTHSAILDAVAEVEARGIATQEGFGSTARLLGGMLRLSAAEARTRVEHAAVVGARRGLTGEPLGPRLPATAAALSSGQLGAGQLRVIAETLAALPVSVPEPVRQRVEADLARYGRDFAPRGLRVIAQRIVATLDPDGREPRDPTPSAPARGELWLRDRRDGRLGLEGWLDPEHGAMVRSMIEQLAAPARTVPDPAVADGVPDPRTVPERQADALIELCERVRATAECPTAGGEPPHLSVTIDWEALRTALGSATLDHRVPISAGDVRRLACDCVLIPVVGGEGPAGLQRLQPGAARRVQHGADVGGGRQRGADGPPADAALQFGCGAGRDDPAVRQHRDGVGQPVGLLQVLVVSRTVVPPCTRVRTISHMPSRLSGFRPVVGSSRNTTSGRPTRLLARSRRAASERDAPSSRPSRTRFCVPVRSPSTETSASGRRSPPADKSGRCAPG